MHTGTPHSTEGVPSITLDEFVSARNLDKVDLLKIDTDGHELSVLKGAHETIRKCRPLVIFEAGLYLMEERGVDFRSFATFFGKVLVIRYSMPRPSRCSLANYRKVIPPRATTDLVAVPLGKVEVLCIRARSEL